MTETTRSRLAIGLAVLALLVTVGGLVYQQGADGEGFISQGVRNFGDVRVEDTLNVDGDIDLDGDGFDVEITAGASIDTDGATNLSASAGDITVDAEAGSVNIIGSEADASAIHLDANDTVTSGINIDTGTVSGMAIDGGPFSVDGTGAFNVNTASGDITVEAETGSVIVKGDEAVATAITLDANEAVTTGLTIVVGSVGGVSVDGGLTDFGTGTYATADGDNDVGIDGDLEVNSMAYLDGGAECNGTLTLENDETIVNSENGVITFTTTTAAFSGAVTTVGNLTVGGTASWGCSDTTISGDLTITGTMTAEDAVITDTLDVDGDIDLDGDGFDVDITAGFSIDGDLVSNISTAAGDLTLEAETGSVIIKGDEEVADAILLNAATTVTQGIDINVGSVYGLSIDGGLTDFGTGTYATADGDNDVGIDGDLEVNGVADFDSTSDFQGLATFQLGLTISDGNAVVADHLRVTAQTAITVTNGAAFAPTGTYQRIQAAGTVTPTITAGTAGDLLVLINTSAQTINIADTSIQMLSAAWAGGQYDVLVLWCDGTNWIEISRSNN